MIDDREFTPLDGSDGICVALALINDDNPRFVRCEKDLHHVDEHKSGETTCNDAGR